ncbi:ATP-binding cassette domain-containing protein [Paludibaculum fermentans]|uniref:Nickel import system ATP-binding protein NikD n=1 Tax=Paludibaculum fermentans TaxID=1473598 RepID=A0A7S7NVR3_PALFE|nr:ABC transporter ATP-binding protein [Paludibaculum fermentans]QOY90707.1 ABC transporter ATP-binding protein [Paludibaculum fermentans]
MRLKISAGYPGKPGVLRDVALEIAPGEIVGLVGRSGEGKSTLILSILGLLGLKNGTCTGGIEFQGRDLLRLKEKEMRKLRGLQIALVPQSPLSALNPNLRLGAQLEECWRAHRSGKPEWQPLLASVSLPTEPAFLRLYPRNLSVGMAQRFLIALALLHRPALLLADEPTSALDTITQAEILALFRRLNQETGVSILYISHDLASVAAICQRVAILHRGELVENAPTEEIFRTPQHPYTRQLLAAIPSLPRVMNEAPPAVQTGGLAALDSVHRTPAAAETTDDLSRLRS